MDTLLVEINSLAKKKKTVGLTDEEKIKQASLRKQYLDLFRGQMRDVLDAVDITSTYKTEIIDLKNNVIDKLNSNENICSVSYKNNFLEVIYKDKNINELEIKGLITSD